MISTDRALFSKGSTVASRMIEYGTLFDELHVIVFSLSRLKHEKIKLSENTTIYPTNAFTKLDYVLNAVALGEEIMGKTKKWIISAQDPFETGLVGYLLKRKSGARLQLQMHGDFWSPYYRKESVMNRLRLLISKLVIPEADCVRVVSERIKKGLKKHFNPACSIQVLPIEDFKDIQNAKPKFDVHEKYPQFSFITLMSSRLEKVKNIDLALLAFRKVVKKNKDAGLIILGDGSKKKYLKDLILKLNLSQNVILEGWQDDVVSYLKSADVFLNTSNHEGYCLSLVEAAKAKCPVITTDVGLIGEVLNESNTLVCPVGDRDCIAGYLAKVINNRSMLKKLGEQEFIDIISASNRKERYLEKYKDSFTSCI
jgi:glycosyltransferase involved in cell wall biosynthesis